MKSKNLKYSIIVILYSLYSFALAQNYLPKIYINEFMASNSNTILSSYFFEYGDWVEIYNAEDTAVYISGYYLTDDLTDPQKWQIPPDTRVNAGKRIIFWADGYNEGLHTNFKLSSDGEEIGLFTSEGEVIDTLHYSEQFSDVSYGRYPNGGENWFFFDPATPGTSNESPGFSGVVPDPKFSTIGGFYQGAHSIEISKSNPLEILRYTLDGSLPNLLSPIYSAPILLDATCVIRAQSYMDNYLPSNVITYTYFIDETTTLPVVSIVTDPENLWDDEIGIYVEGTNGISGYCVNEPRNWNQPWERPISLEMYEANRDFAFKIHAGMQIGGGCTRKYPEKTLAIYTRSEYGDTKINYPVFKDKPITQYNNILLRNSGQDWWRGMFRDGFMHTLVKDQMDIDWQAYKPAILFLNGDYWGIHGIREKHNEHYLESNYGIDPDKIDILSSNAYIKQGSSNLYTAMINFINTHNMAIAENYDWVTTQMDINEYLNYMISEIYFANIDWPAGNIKYWRQQGENNKWRWILFDTDLGFGAHELGQYDSNTLENVTVSSSTYYANPSWSTLLFRKLLESPEFKNQFIQRAASLLNIAFSPQRVLHVIDSLKTTIEAEIPRHIQKWEQSTSFNTGWSYHVNMMQEFAVERPAYMIEHMIGKFGLSGSFQLTVNYDNPERGNVFLSGVKLPSNSFNGTYLKDIPLQCTAVPKRGYRFAGWQGASTSLNDTVNLVLTTDSNLEALFEIDESTIFYGLRINEILALNDQSYHDEHNEYDDWVELYNDSREAIDIGGMYLTDDFSQPDKWQIPISSPDSTTIQAGEFLLLWADKNTEQGILHLNFKLSGDGEEIGLSKRTGREIVFIDTVSLGTQTTDISYGRSPDGGDDLTFFTVPTPGYQNISSGIAEDNVNIPIDPILNQNYPNPFNPITSISFVIPEASELKLSIYDISGHLVETLVNDYRQAGQYNVKWDASNYSAGIYIYRLESNVGVDSRKMLLIK